MKYLAALMVEHGLFNVKGMGGLNNLLQKYKELLVTMMFKAADEKGIVLPSDLFNKLTIDTYEKVSIVNLNPFNELKIKR